ncbi:protein-glutamate O-methyltransferase CheR [Paracoccus sp. IB05]|nr:protein-glutamate O-methyltransferase CheR [Paracoccus sp. IB05]
MTLTARRTLIPPDPGSSDFSDAEFRRVADYAQREFGLVLQENKKQVVQSRITRLLQEFQCTDIASFCSRLESGNFQAERAAFVTALTTNVTSFFREAHHFDIFAESLLKPSLSGLRSGQRLRAWSAGCSAGQEPGSVAMRILDLLPDAAKLNIRILATDIDPAIIAKARAAIYPEEEARGIPPTLRNSFITTCAAGYFSPDPRVTGLIRFAELNLVGDWPIRGPFDAIFCRNVAIYFDKPTQARLWSRFAGLLRPGGLLFIGHSERVSGPAMNHLVSAGITTYRRSQDIKG